MKIASRMLAYNAPSPPQSLVSILSTSPVSIFLHPHARAGANAFSHLQAQNVLNDEGPSCSVLGQIFLKWGSALELSPKARG
jgi:hypothetical protein